MRKNKALLFMLLGCIMASSMAFTACGIDSSSTDSQPSNSDSQIIESSDIDLVDFEDETISVAIGDTYTLPNDVVLDTKDNDYPVTYTVKNQAGEEISVINNQFIVSEAGGYVITCVASLPNGKTETRTITLTVSDSEAPTISIGACPIGYVNKEYVLPTIIITDADQNGLTSTVKVYAVGDETEIAVSDGKFTPTVAGEYIIKVNAQDGSGNTSSDEVKFIVRGEMAPFVLEDFQDNYGTEIFTMEENGYNTEDAQWLDSFDPTPDNGENADARNGVASVAFEEHEYGPHFCVRLPQEMATADFGYVYVRAYIKSAVSEYVPTVKAHSSNEFIGEYNVNEWVEIRIAVEDINSETSWFSTSKNEDETAMECFRRMMTQEKGAPLFWFPTFNVSYTDGEGNSVKDSADNYTVYVDEIGYRPVVNPEMSVEESYELGEYVTLNATVDTDLDESEYALQYTVTDPSGNSVSLDAENKFRLMEVGDYTVSVKFIHESYGGENTYTLHCVSTRSILVDEFTGAPKLGDTVTLPNATFEGGEITTSVKLDGCDDTIAVVDGAFVAGVAGTYKVTYQVNLEGLIYKTEIDITVTHELGKGEVLGFNKADDLNATALYNGVNANSVTWLPAYNGEYGVAKYTFDGEWPFITFTSAQAKEVYENGALLVIRAYVASGAVAIPELILSNGEVTAKSGACVQDQWVDYTFDIAPFLAYWFDGNEDVWTSNARIWWFGQNTSDIGMLYISDIKVVYSAQASGITVAVDGEKQAGEELTVTMNVPEGVTGATLVVRNSDGETITLTDNKFAPKAGTYTVEISCDGYDLVWTQTFEVVPIDITMDVAESYELGSYLTLNAAANTSVQGEMQYMVLDPDGEEVAVTENQFRFMKTGEYTVTAKFAHDLYGVEEVFTLNCVSTLSVEVDEYVGSPKVGETVTLPTATFDGNSAGITVGVKLDGYDYTVETENNTFIANVAGKYVVTYTKDDDGFIYNKAIEIEVGYEVVENEVLGFNQASDLNNTALYNTVNANSVTWLPAYNGEYGVAKYTFDGEWPFITFTPAQAKAAYEEGNNCIVIRAYVVDGEAAIPELILSNGEITAKSGNCTYGEWVDYKFDIAPFLAYWFEEVENVWDSNARIWWFGKNVSASGEIYIADIKVAYDEAFEKDDENEGGEGEEGGEGGEVVPVTNPVFFDMANASSLKFSTDVADGTMEYIDATKVAADTTLPAIPEGESGYMKLSGTAAAWNALPIFLTPQTGADVVSQYSYLEFWYYNPNGGQAVVAGNWSEVATGADAQWYKVSISIADYYAANNADWYNALSSWLPFLQFRGTGGGAFTTVYVSSITLSNDVPPINGPVFFDMANASSLKFSTDVADGTMEYIDATKVAADTTLPAIPEGESGYMKLSGTAAAWNALPIFLTPQAGADVVSQYSYLEFWYYNPNGGQAVVAGNWSEVAMGADAQWYKVSISIADYYTANNEGWYDALSSWLPFLQFRGTGGGTYTTVYVSSITLSNDVPPINGPVFFDMANASSLKFGSDITDGTMEYIDATKVAADTMLPAIPEGENGYMKLSGTAAAWNALPIFLTPQTGADVVSQYSYLEFWYYNPDGGKAVVAGNWNEVATGADAQWYKVSISIADYYAANNADWYNALSSWLPFLQFRGTGGGAFTTVYISSIYLTK